MKIIFMITSGLFDAFLRAVGGHIAVNGRSELQAPNFADN